MEEKTNFHSGYLTIIGKPNAGKSTLINYLLQTKLSAVSPKEQTTRRRIIGIYTDDRMQMVMIDTPGILSKTMHKMHEKMQDEIKRSLENVDVILFMIDINKIPEDIPDILKKTKTPIIVGLNKIDSVPKGDVVIALDNIANRFENIKEIVPISALKGTNIPELLDVLYKYLPEGDYLYDPELITTSPERFFVAEIIREKLFNFLHQEIPYSTAVIIEEFKEREKGKDYIRATILVERDSQKGIVIGKKGSTLKKIGSAARKDIEFLLGRKVFLDLHVKVRKDWRNNDYILREIWKDL